MRSTLVAVALCLLFAAPVAAEEAVPEAKPEPEVTRIPEISVTETRHPRSTESLTGRTDVRDLGESRDRGAWTLDEAIEDIPGVDIQGDSRYGQEVKVQMRGVTSGYSTQRVLVLLDGRPLTSEYLGAVDIAVYPLAAFERVEVARGPASAAYGTNALGGVINYIPRRGAETPVTEGYIEGGSFSTFNAGFSHGSKLGPVDIFLNVDTATTDGYMRNSRGDRMDWDRTAGFLNVGYETDRMDVRAYLHGHQGKGTDEDFDRDVERWSADLSFAYDFAPESEALFRLRAYHNDEDQELAWFEVPATRYDFVSDGVIVTQSFRVHSAHLLTGGGELRRQDARVREFAGDVDETEDTWSLFLQDEWSVTDGVGIVGQVMSTYSKPPFTANARRTAGETSSASTSCATSASMSSCTRTAAGVVPTHQPAMAPAPKDAIPASIPSKPYSTT